MVKNLKTMGIILIIILILLGGGVFMYLQQPQFGQVATGDRLMRMQQSPNYKDGKFVNRFPTRMLPEGYSMAGEIYRTFIKHTPRKFPTDSIPSVKTDLKSIPLHQNLLIWFGHSSYYMQLDGKRILVDPVLSGAASPLPIGVKAFPGTDIYDVADFPTLDYLLITHDHFDHLDYKTVMALQPKVKQVVCGLGVGASLAYWGYQDDQLVEMDWDEKLEIATNYKLYTVTAKHGSGRSIHPDNTLWLSFVISSPSMQIFVGGDSGYDVHFKEIGKSFGPFDLAILDNGQYGEDDFATIHMSPKYTLMAAQDLQAKRLFPVHSSKFVLSRHAWDEPLLKISALLGEDKSYLVLPKIGEAVDLHDRQRIFDAWWEGVN